MKNPIFKVVLSICISLLMFACGSAETKLDTSTKDAEKVVDQLHELLAQQKYTETHALFSDKFKKVNDWDQIHVIYDSTANLGAVKKKEVTSVEVTPGVDETINYNLIFQVTRTKINSTEQYHMQKEGDEVKIVSFKILSVPFIE